MWRHSGRASDRLVLAAAGLSIYSKSGRLSLLCSEQAFLSPNTKPNAVNIVCPELLLFLTPGQALFFFLFFESDSKPTAYSLIGCTILQIFSSIVTKSSSFTGWRLLISELGNPV